MKLPSFPVEGGCQCGAVRYRIGAAPRTVYRCYCKDCQRSSGATHSMSMIAWRDDVTQMQGELVAYEKVADSGRRIHMMGCARCGTKVWNEPLASPEIRVVKPGTLDDMNWAEPVGNIWTASRPSWATIDEAAVNFPGQPPDRQPLYDAWAKAASEG